MINYNLCLDDTTGLRRMQMKNDSTLHKTRKKNTNYYREFPLTLRVASTLRTNRTLLLNGRNITFLAKRK